MAPTLGDWVKAQYLQQYCDEKGKLTKPINMDRFRSDLHTKRPEQAQNITDSLKRLGEQICMDICGEFTREASGCFSDPRAVAKRLRKMRPDMQNSIVLQVLKKAEEHVVPADEDPLPKWIHEQYIAVGFTNTGFIGYNKLKEKLASLRPEKRVEIYDLVDRFRKQGDFESEKSVMKAKAAQRNQMGGVQLAQVKQTAHTKQGPPPHDIQSGLKTLFPGSFPKPAAPAKSTVTTPLAENVKEAKQSNIVQEPRPNINVIGTSVPRYALLSKKLQHLGLLDGRAAVLDEEMSETDSGSEASDDEHSVTYIGGHADGPDFDSIDLLTADKLDGEANKERVDEDSEVQIRHAPLLSGDIIMHSSRQLLPQYGFIGNHVGESTSPGSKVFLNTNVPFSAFICGVQGSGKSHTTSCILENALISSNHLGRLENPVSALVFSYGEFSGNGAGFNVSEAAFLAAPHTDFSNHLPVKKITVLTSPSNPSIRKLYNKLPNVTAIPFKLKAASLDIGAMLTLMAVNESSSVPLYMATVESILRNLATENEDGGFNYIEFKERLKLCDFNPTQLNMLEMRLGLLESFIDMKGDSPQPEFRPGEVTIMDLSCPFVTANTACVLFKLGLQQFLQSQTPGKLVVLDEAHKYMLNTPGAKALNDYLLTVIRLQRHFGARVVVATQEPTLLTDLIALCSVVVIHRFSSPQWLSAIKKHIPISDPDILEQIEDLKRGTALVYSPNAILGKDNEGALIKGIGKLLKLHIRKRVTSDGGQSVLCV